MLRRSRRFMVADLGASHVACGAFSKGRNGRLILENVFVDTLAGDVSLDSLWREAVGRSLVKISQDPRFRGPLSIGLPGHLALTKFIKTPAIDQSQRSKVIQFEATQNIPYPLSDVVWDHLIVSDDGTELEIVISAVKAEMMVGLCAAVTSAGHSVAHAGASCIALHDAFRYSYPDIQENTLVIDVGARSTHLLLIERGRFFGRTLPFGGNAVTQGMAERLGLEFASAEVRKKELLVGGTNQLIPSISGRALASAVESFCVKLTSEINRSAANFSRQTSAPLPTTAYVTGGGAQIDIVPSILAGKLKIPVHRFESLRQVDVAIPAHAGAISSEAVLAGMIGLACRCAADPTRSALDLLPAVVRKEIVFRRRQPALIAASALAVMALIPPLHHFQGLANAGQADVDGKEAQLQPLREIHARNTDLQKRIERVRNTIAEMQGANEKKTSWLRFLIDLQERLVAVEDVWLESLSIVRNPSAVRLPNARAGELAADLRLVLSGRLLDERNPVSKVSPESYLRIKELISSFKGSEFVAAVERERFDNSQSGILRFEFTLVIRPEKPL